VLLLLVFYRSGPLCLWAADWPPAQQNHLLK
jgi:hypothetical protein